MRIFFVTRDEGSWIDKDREILSKHHEVTYKLLDKKFVLSFWQWLPTLRQQDAVFAWFGSFFVLPFLIFGRLLGKKVVLVAGGFDVAKAPEIGHGAFTKGPFSKWLRKFLFRWPHIVVTVSKSNTSEAIENAKVPEGKTRLIPLGFDSLPKTFLVQPWSARKKQVAMISSCMGSYYTIKGVDQFVELARLMPDWEFVLMGSADDQAKKKLSEGPKNLRAVGYIPFRSPDFYRLLQDSRFILQLSYYESFGAAVVDAALIGCYPIVYNQFGLSELVQDFGKAEKYGDLESVKKIIQKTNEEPINCSAISKAFHARYAGGQREKGLLECFKI